MKGPELIYIIEDDPLSGFLAELIIKREQPDCQVRVYVNGERAFECIQAALDEGRPLPDLILLDLNMPMMDGWDFLDAFSDLNMAKPVPVCVLTSSIRPSDMERATRYQQVKGYFAKPLNEQMVRQMQQLVEDGVDTD